MKLVSALALLVFIAPPAFADITIGVSAPLTGPAASVSEISLPGLKQAVADINAAGGVQVNGKSELMKLEILDDTCDPKQAVAVAGKFAAQRPVAVIALSCSGAVKAAASTYDDEGIPYFAAVASNPDLSHQGYKTFVRPASRDDQDADAAVNFIATKFTGKKVAIVDDKEAWGKGIGDLVETGLRAKSFKTVDRYQVNPGEQDFNAVVSRLKNNGYDVVYVAALMREAGLLIRQIAAANYHPAIASSMAIAMPDALAIIGPAREGIYFTRVGLDAKALELSRKFNANSETTGIYNLQAYATMQVLAQALPRAGIVSQAILADLHSQTFKTVLGDLKFDANGDISDMRFDIMQYQGGKPVKIQH